MSFQRRNEHLVAHGLAGELMRRLWLLQQGGRAQRPFQHHALARLQLSTGGMEFASEMVIRAARLKLDIREFPIDYHPRGGESKLSTFREHRGHLGSRGERGTRGVAVVWWRLAIGVVLVAPAFRPVGANGQRGRRAPLLRCDQRHIINSGNLLSSEHWMVSCLLSPRATSGHGRRCCRVGKVAGPGEVTKPAVVVFAVHWLLVWSLGWIAAAVWSIAILYSTLGFRQFSHHFTYIRDALDQGREDRARELLAQWRHVDASELPRTELLRHVIEYSLLAAHRQIGRAHV